MRIHSLRPIIWVNDVKKTIDYYVNTLGFSQTGYDDATGWGQVARDGVAIMFSTPNDHMLHDKLQFTGSFYFTTGDVESWWQLLKDKAAVFYPMEDFDYGMREFAVTDCNGYILQFGQDMNAAPAIDSNDID